MRNLRFWTLVGITLTAAMSRLLPHPPNFTPIGAIALFGGANFPNRRSAFAVPLGAMLLSDAVLGLVLYGWHTFSLIPFVYASFALTVCLGLWLRGQSTPATITGTCLVSSVFFYLISNFGVWLRGTLYPPTLEGLVTCYVAALPFFRNMLLADVVYSALLFGGFALAERHIPALRQEASGRA